MQPDFDHITITDNQSEHRYEARVGDAVAVLEYARDGKQIALIHTGVPNELEGHGIAGKLTKFALDDARGQELEVIPVCPFVVSYLRRHPDELDIVAANARDRVSHDRP